MVFSYICHKPRYMFLNGLKTKSIIRQLEKVNTERVPVTVGNRLQSVCIIEVASNVFDRTKLHKLADMLSVKEEDILFRSFVKHKKKEDKDNTTLFSPKDIGWKGVFKTPGLKEIQTTTFDILISYYTQEHIVLTTVSSLGKGLFKIGLGEDNYQAHDLCLEVKVGDTDVFLSELKKYLKILKII